MTSMPASRSARAMILAPRSCPSSPGLATTTRILRAVAASIRARNFIRSPRTSAVRVRLRPGGGEPGAEQDQGEADEGAGARFLAEEDDAEGERDHRVDVGDDRGAG